MRPAVQFLMFMLVIAAAQVSVIGLAQHQRVSSAGIEEQMQAAVTTFGLSDLCIATDARYIRNPALSDQLAPYMDHPGNIEHFPTGSFWIPQP